MKKSIETSEMKVTIRLDAPDNSLTPEQQGEFEAQVSQADPTRLLWIVQQMLRKQSEQPLPEESLPGTKP